MVNDELVHHGVKGQKWGVRRYQNEDGTLTEEGKKKYRRTDIMEAHRDYNKRWNRNSGIIGGAAGGINAVGNAVTLGAAGLLGTPAAIPVLATAAGLTVAQYALATKAVSAVVGRHRLKKIKDLNDESLKTGRDTAIDVVAIYGKHKIKGKEN